MRPLTIATVELVRLFRDRSNIFFVLILPLLLVILIGVLFGGGLQTSVGIVAPADDPAAEDLRAAIDATEGMETRAVGDAEELLDKVSRGELTSGLVVPDGYDAAVSGAREATISYVGRADTAATSVRAVIDALVAEQTAPASAARAAAEVTGQPTGELVALAGQLVDDVAAVDVVVDGVGGDALAEEFAGLGQFDLGASAQLFLFVFLTAMTSGAALIQTRQHGIARRMLATPTAMATILAGQAGGRFLVALFQAGYIVAATALLFGVNWGDPLATAAVVVVFSLAAAGAGMLVGSVFSNDSQAAGAGVGLGLVLAALGGSMMPLELFTGTMRVVASLTPHAWANGAMAEIVRRDGTMLDVLPHLGVLAAYAGVLLALATLALRRALTR